MVMHTEESIHTPRFAIPEGEPASVADAIAANPDRYDAPADEPDVGEPDVDVSDEPSVDTPEPVDEPAVDVVEEDPAVPADEPATDDPFAEFGGRDAIEQAHRLYQASQTDDGIVQLFLEAGTRLGLGYDQIEKLFSAGADTPAGEEDESDPFEDERPLTVAEWKEYQAQQAKERAEAEQAKQVQVARQIASTTVADTLKGLGVENGTEVAADILRLGDKYLDRGNLDPEAVKQAVERGHADYLAIVEREQKGYLAKKKAKADSVPKSPSGSGAPSAEPPAEPQNTVEAIKLARERLRAQGSLT